MAAPCRQILLADDISNQTPAGLRRSQWIRASARILARRLDIGVDLVYVEDLRARNSLRELHQAELEQREVELNLALRGASQKQLRCSTRWILRFGAPAEEILRLAASKPCPELILMGTEGKTGLSRWIVGSVAEEVIRHSDRPVLVLGPKLTGPLQLGRAKPRILVATELGRNSRPAEQYALSLARRLGAEVVLFHSLWDGFRVIQENALNSGIVTFDIEETLDEIRRDAIRTLKSKVRYFQERGVPCEFRLEEAVSSAQAIPGIAEEKFDLLVVGTHGRNVLLTAFFGSTARECVLRSSIPVIVVRSR